MPTSPLLSRISDRFSPRQSYGVLIAFDETEEGDLKPVQVSENSPRILGISPSSFFQRKCLTAFLTPDSSETLRDALDMLGESDFAASPSTFELSGRSTSNLSNPNGRPWTAFCAIHRPDPKGNPSRAILELELVDASFSKAPVPTPPLEEIEEPDYIYQSFLPPDKFPELQRMKRMRARAKARTDLPGGVRKPSDALRMVELISEIEEEFRTITDIDTFAKVLTVVFKELTEFNRVMLYVFDDQWNGAVIAEEVHPKSKSDYMGVSFPAADIPAQARDLYVINKVRLLFHREVPTSRLVCSSLEEVEQPLNMSHAFLRAMSPIHLK
ncbi:hypothetical protein RQP46_002344 [Phenoliferia psychrophenolica]